LGIVGFRWVLLGPRGQSDGQSEKEMQSNILYLVAVFSTAWDPINLKTYIKCN
jgi:hypothetical protein